MGCGTSAGGRISRLEQKLNAVIEKAKEYDYYFYKGFI